MVKSFLSLCVPPYYGQILVPPLSWSLESRPYNWRSGLHLAFWRKVRPRGWRRKFLVRRLSEAVRITDEVLHHWGFFFLTVETLRMGGKSGWLLDIRNAIPAVFDDKRHASTWVVLFGGFVYYGVVKIRVGSMSCLAAGSGEAQISHDDEGLLSPLWFRSDAALCSLVLLLTAAGFTLALLCWSFVSI